MTRLTITTIIAFSLFAPLASANLSDRAGYIGTLLRAVEAMPQQQRTDLTRELRIGARGKCRAGFSTPDVRCVLEVARATCAAKQASARPACRLVADVAVANFLAEKQWIDKKTRVSIMNDSDDFQAGMRRELRARYAGLVAGLTMMRGFDRGAGLAASIDKYCVARAKRRVLTWSRCVAAIVWYIAAAPATKAPANNGRQPPRD